MFCSLNSAVTAVSASQNEKITLPCLEGKSKQ